MISFSSLSFFKGQLLHFFYPHLNFQWDTTFRIKSRAFACILPLFLSVLNSKIFNDFLLQVEYNSLVIKQRPSKIYSQPLFPKLFSSILLYKRPSNQQNSHFCASTRPVSPLWLFPLPPSQLHTHQLWSIPNASFHKDLFWSLLTYNWHTTLCTFKVYNPPVGSDLPSPLNAYNWPSGQVLWHFMLSTTYYDSPYMLDILVPSPS